MPGMRVVVDDVAEAMDRSPDEPFDRRLDLKTGTVELIGSSALFGDAISPELEAALETEPDRFVDVPRVETREQFLWMAEFADAIEEDDVRTRLSSALAGRGAFSRFKAVLYEYADLRDRWYAIRERRMLDAAEEWLRTLDVELQIERRPRPEPKPKATPASKKPALPLRISHALLLGQGEPASAPGRVRRVVTAKGQGRALFKQLVRDLCETRGVGYRNRFIEGKTTFELDDTTLRHDEHRVELEVEVPEEIRSRFA